MRFTAIYFCVLLFMIFCVVVATCSSSIFSLIAAFGILQASTVYYQVV